MGRLADSILTGLRPLARKSLARAANRARDARRYAKAAELYARALNVDPSQVALRVQLANMLKDSGRFEAAETEYLAVLVEWPRNADVHLQLGHLYKTTGRRSEAIDRFRQAKVLDPGATSPTEELALLGDREALEARFRAENSAGVAAVFPPAHYDALRRVWEPPPPPDGARRQVSVLVTVGDLSQERLTWTARAIQEQSSHSFQLILRGADSVRQAWAEQLAASDDRVELADGEGRFDEYVSAARHDLIVVPEPGAILHRHALAWFGWAAANTPAAAFVCDQERRSDPAPDAYLDVPALRHAVDHELLLQANPFGRTIAFDRTRWRGRAHLADLVRTETAVLELLLDLSAEGAVGHIPYPLVAVPTGAGGGYELEAAAYAAVVRDHLGRRGLIARTDVTPIERESVPGAMVRWRPSHRGASINVVIPTRDNGADIRTMTQTLRSRAANFEAVQLTVVDNGSIDPATIQVLSQLKSDGVKVLRADEPFNWSRLSNLGASNTPSDIVLFANDDMEMLTDRWDDQLRGLLDRPEVGVVGAKLLYPDNTIQHAGILFGWCGRAIHDGLYEDRYAAGPGGRWQLRRRVSAVTGAFFGMRKALFDEIGGFDERRLAIGYSDLDMSLKVRRHGLAVLYAPEIELTHYESKSRGLTHLSEPADALDKQELSVLRARWPGELDTDVTVHPAWYAATLPFRLLAAPSRTTIVERLIANAEPDPWRPGAPQDPI